MAWRVAFAGSPPFAATILQALIGSKHRVDLVYTQPDRPAGRGRRLAPSATRTLAEARGITVRTPKSLEGEAKSLAEFDVLAVAAYGLVLPPPVLDAPRHGCLNVHASLLPRWRGAAPVERAIMAGDAETGVSIMRINAGLDTGPVVSQRRLPLSADATGAAVREALAHLGAAELLAALDALPNVRAVPQDDRLATYAPKLAAAESRIDWRRSAAAIDAQVRALSGRNAAYATVGDARLRILAGRPLPAGRGPGAPPGSLARQGGRWRVACGNGALEVHSVQLNRGKGTPQPMQSAVNGYPRLLFDGARLG